MNFEERVFVSSIVFNWDTEKLVFNWLLLFYKTAPNGNTCLLRPPCAEIELFNRLIPSLATSWIVKKPLTTPSLEDLESTTHPILVKTALVKMGEVGVMAICEVKLHFGRTTTRICLWMTLKPWTKSCLDNLPDFGKKLVTFVGRFWHNYCEHVCRDYI